MSTRTTTWLAILGAILCVALSLAAGVIMTLAGTYEEYVVLVASTTIPLVGWLLVGRRPENRLGWVMALAGTELVVAGLAYALSLYSDTHGDVVGQSWLDWFNAWAYFPGYGALVIWMLLLFPTGDTLSARWRRIGWAVSAAFALFIGIVALRPGRLPDSTSVNPVGIGVVEDLATTLEPVLVIALPLIIGLPLASSIVRFRRSVGIERIQMKWFVWTAATSVALYFSGVLLTVAGPATAAGDILLSIAVVTLQVGLPAAIVIAILRYRLYDIDTIINRTIVYGVLTGGLGAAYIGSVVLLQALLDPLTSGSDLAVAVSTLGVAALFRPARARVQRAVDRRFYRERYDAARTLSAFSARLRDEVDLDVLSADIRTVVHDTVQPRFIGIWLRER